MTAMHPPVSGREISNPPSDGISNIRFSNHSDHLLVSSWDRVLLLFLLLLLLLSETKTLIRFYLLLLNWSVYLIRASDCTMRARTSCGGSSCTRDRSWTAASMTILPVLAPVLIVLCGGERDRDCCPTSFSSCLVLFWICICVFVFVIVP